MIKTQIKNATILNIDCMEYMRTLPDKFFDLAIVDPQYGLNMSKEKPRKSGRFAMNSIPKKWDEKIPDICFFKELERISGHQIIWGGNYFPLPPTQGFIFWYKHNPVDNFSDGEFAWTSFKRPAKCFDFKYYGNIEGNSSASKKIHISQKPVKLYEWLLTNYAKPGQTIFDSHMGSGSSAIAANNLGFEFVGCEMDADYYAAACKRIAHHAKQERLF